MEVNKEQVVFKRSLKGMLGFIAGIIAFVLGGLWMLSFDEIFYRVIGGVAIIFFGGGGLLVILFGSLWQPIASVSNEGVTVYLRAKKQQFITWSNVKRIEVVTQEVNHGHQEKYVGVFAIDDTLVEGVGGALLEGIGKAVTDWDEMPAMLISPNFSNVTHDEILNVLQEFHQEYQENEAWMYENNTT